MDAPNPVLAEILEAAADLMLRFDALLADANQEPATVRALGELADDMAKRFDEALRQVAIRERHDAQRAGGAS